MGIVTINDRVVYYDESVVTRNLATAIAGVPPNAARTITIPAQDRTRIVAAQDRTTAIQAEDRTVIA